MKEHQQQSKRHKVENCTPRCVLHLETRTSVSSHLPTLKNTHTCTHGCTQYELCKKGEEVQVHTHRGKLCLTFAFDWWRDSNTYVPTLPDRVGERVLESGRLNSITCWGLAQLGRSPHFAQRLYLLNSRGNKQTWVSSLLILERRKKCVGFPWFSGQT